MSAKRSLEEESGGSPSKYVRLDIGTVFYYIIIIIIIIFFAPFWCFCRCFCAFLVLLLLFVVAFCCLCLFTLPQGAV